MIGIAACQPLPLLYEEGLVTAEIINEDRAEIAQELDAAEAQFRATLKGRAAALEWRSTETYASLADFIAEEARAADLIVTGRDMGGTMFDNTRRVNIGDLAMRAGRPVLIVPKGISALPLENVFLGWKDTREARRAAADALPLLRAAEAATVLETASHDNIREAEGHVKDVATWLGRHGILAEPLAVTCAGMEIAGLHKSLREGKCDLLIAGAYAITGSANGYSAASRRIFCSIRISVF